MHNIKECDRHESTYQAWHGLSVIRPDLTLDNCWLNRWDVEPAGMARLVDGNWQWVDHKILACTDDNEITVGAPYNPDSYKPIDNQAFLGLIKQSIGGTEHELVSVGSVRNRGRVFASIKLNGMEEFKAAGRTFSAYLNFGNGHDKSSTLWVNTSNICTVCDNTFNANLFSGKSRNSDDIRYRVRHTKNAEQKLPQVAGLIDKAIGVQATFQIAFEELSHKEVTTDQARVWLTGFENRKQVTDSTRKQNRVDHMIHLFESGKGNAGENKADLFSAVTDYYTHETSKNKRSNYYNSEFGRGSENKRDAFVRLTDREEFEKTMSRGQSVITTRNAKVFTV